MKQYSFLTESGNGILSKFGGTKSQRNSLSKYLKKRIFIRRVYSNPKEGNDTVRKLGKMYIKNGYQDTLVDSINGMSYKNAIDLADK